MQIKKGVRPKLALEGCGGTYFVRSVSQHKIAVFKPEDEEPFAPNNPRSFVGMMHSPGIKPGVRSGEAAVREVAAYLLDSQVRPPSRNIPLPTCSPCAFRSVGL